MPALCRDCGTRPAEDATECLLCGSFRILRHKELFSLQLAHIDCDAFYASVEKRDRPELADKPLIVGGGKRGVVTTACYIARLSGVKSAMPMFKALKACPDAVVIQPDFTKYVAAARQIRALMQRLTPLVQPLSIDEAVLDLAGTEALHGAPPAAVLARLALDVEREVGVTISIGLARNRLMAKIAVERDKPRGFAVIGGEAAELLAPESVRLLPGIGPVQERRLAAMGIATLGQLQALDPRQAMQRLGEDGPALVRRARGEDDAGGRSARARRKSISAETTFDTDLGDLPSLERHLWRMTEKLAGRPAQGRVLRRRRGAQAQDRGFPPPHARRPARLALAAARHVVRGCPRPACAGGGRHAFRLIGIGANPLLPAHLADQPDLADPDAPRRSARQAAIDALQSRYGAAIITRGRSLG